MKSGYNMNNNYNNMNNNYNNNMNYPFGNMNNNNVNYGIPAALPVYPPAPRFGKVRNKRLNIANNINSPLPTADHFPVKLPNERHHKEKEKEDDFYFDDF